MSEQNNRDVRKKEISQSFRGILRVSPNEDGADIGITEALSDVSDSVGNISPLQISTNEVYNTKTFKSANTQLLNTVTLGSTTNLPTAIPKNEDVLIGNSTGDYIQYNLRKFIDEYIQSSEVLENLVPVGTVINTLLPGLDLSILPSRYQNHYDLAIGQSSHTISGLEYNDVNFPELYNIVSSKAPDKSYISLNLFTKYTVGEEEKDDASAIYYFYEDDTIKPSVISKISINGTEIVDNISYTVAVDKILLKNLTIPTSVTSIPQTVDIYWSQKAQNINETLELTKIDVFLGASYAKTLYLKAGTVVRITPLRYTYNDKIYELGLSVDKEDALVYRWSTSTSQRYKKNLKADYTIPEDGIYSLVFSMDIPTSATIVNNIHFSVEVPAYDDCTLKLDVATENYAYLPTISQNETEILSKKITEPISSSITAGFIPDTRLRFQVNNLKYYYYAVFKFNNNITYELNKNIYYSENYLYKDFNYTFTDTTRQYSFYFYLNQGTKVTLNSGGSTGAIADLTYLWYDDSSLLLVFPDHPNASIIVPQTGWYHVNGSTGSKISFVQNSEVMPFVSGEAKLFKTVLNNSTSSETTESGETSTSFRLPDLRNKFIRSASDIEVQITDSSDGTYVIKDHKPGLTEYAETNLSQLTDATSTSNTVSKFQAPSYGYFTTNQEEAINYLVDHPESAPTGAFSTITQSNPELTYTRQTFKGSSYCMPITTYKFDASKLFNRNISVPKETHPYNMSLVPLIKVK